MNEHTLLNNVMMIEMCKTTIIIQGLCLEIINLYIRELIVLVPYH